MEMSRTDQIQIGMLGVIIVLLLIQLSGVFSGDGDLATSAKQDLMAGGDATTTIGAPAATTPVSPTTPAAAPPTAPPTAPAVDPNQPKTQMTFSEQEFNFGTVNEGEKVKHTFKFKNTGNEPLIISNAQGSCGCTVPKWPREPIAPGASNEIVVEFNSEKKTGKRNQQVTITANTEPAQTIIKLVGDVTPKGGAATDNNASPIQINPGQ